MTQPGTHVKPDAPDAPDVITFPPVIFIAFYAIGYITDRAFPAELGTPSARYAAGGLLLALGGALVIWAIAQFVRARTAVDVRKPATALVTGGPYRLSRNPMYVAMALTYGGFAIAFSLPVTLAFLAVCLTVLQIGVVSREEAYLERKFGDPYRQYRAQVRRWL